jgi:putative methionine-R-sulfoxide reductase with GAF domain
MIKNMKQNKPRAPRSLTTILAIAFITLSVVVLLSNSTMTLYFNVKAYQDSLAKQQTLIAQDAGKTVSNYIDQKFSILETTIEVDNPFDVSPEQRQTILESLLGHDLAFRQFALLSRQGSQLSQVSRVSFNLSSQFTGQLTGDLLAQVSADQRYIGPIYIDASTSEPLVTIAVPAKNVFGEYQGVLVAEINLKFMWDLVDQLKIGEAGYAYVVDNQGTLIAFRDVSRILRGENVRHIFEVNEFVENPAGANDTTLEVSRYPGLTGEDVVGTYAPLGSPQWAVVVELPWGEAYQPIIQATAIPIANVSVLVILSGVVGVFLARRLTRPLVELTNVATRIASGETGLRVEVSGANEVVTLADAFNSMTAQLREFITSLEERVAARTRDLATVAEVGTATGAILETSTLLQQVVDLTKERFNLYHSHIYLLDDAGENLVLAAGAGEPGRQMVAEGRSIPLNREQSLVARAARERKGVTVNDVTQAPDFLPNPLLPDTRSELAVPMLAGDTVVGVFDVQSDLIGRFTEADINIQTTLAAQLAISVQNARSFERTKAQADLETMANTIGQRIQRTGSVEETLQVAIREIGAALGASRVKVNLGRNRQDDDNDASRN